MLKEFAPITNIIHGAPIGFHIEGSGKHDIDLNNSTLEVRVKLTRQGLEISEQGLR